MELFICSSEELLRLPLRLSLLDEQELSVLELPIGRREKGNL